MLLLVLLLKTQRTVHFVQEATEETSGDIFKSWPEVIEGIKIWNLFGIFESDFYLIHMGIWDKSFTAQM